MLTMKQYELWMTVKDVCEYLQISKSTVYRLIDQAVLKPYKISETGRAVRFKREEIDDYLRQQRNQ